MSVLQINKKAITEADGQRLIDQTCCLRAPLGTPTEFVRLEDFRRYETGIKTPYLHSLVSKFSDAVSVSKAMLKATRFVHEGMDYRSAGIGEYFSALRNVRDVSFDILNSYFGTMWTLKSKGYKEYADNYGPEDYKQPKAALIKVLPRDVPSGNLIGHALEIKGGKLALQALTRSGSL